MFYFVVCVFLLLYRGIAEILSTTALLHIYPMDVESEEEEEDDDDDDEGGGGSLPSRLAAKAAARS